MNYGDAHTPHRVTKQYDPTLYDAPKGWVEEGKQNVWDMPDNDNFDDKYKQNYRDIYGAAIDYLDRVVSNLIESIQSETMQETTFIITADHGHDLGYSHENGLFSHSASVSEGVLHVPLLIVNGPPNLPSKVQDYFSHLDLGELILRCASNVDTIEDIVGGPIAVEHDGFGDNKEHKRIFEGTSSEWKYWNRMIRVIYENNHKIEWDSRGETKKYEIDIEQPASKNNTKIIDDDWEIPPSGDEYFDIPINEYQDKINNMTEDIDVADDLRALGYL